jgi:hypothetical protein
MSQRWWLVQTVATPGVDEQSASGHVEISNDVVFDKSLSATQVVLLALVASYGDSKGRSLVSSTMLGDSLSLSSRTIQRHLNVLRDRSLLSWQVVRLITVPHSVARVVYP